jgi:hypothetical protein
MPIQPPAPASCGEYLFGLNRGSSVVTTPHQLSLFGYNLRSIGNLKFRDHRLTTVRTGVKAWPPVWITASGKTTTGEIGILQDVAISLLIETTLFLFIDYQDSRYGGSLSFDDSISCQKIYDRLKSNVGRSIREIGDLELKS